MFTRRLYITLLVLCALVATGAAARVLSIAVDAGQTHVEYDSQQFSIESTAPVVVHFSTTRGGDVAVEVELAEGEVSANVQIIAIDDGGTVIFSGEVRDADDFADLFWHDEAGRGEQ